MENLELVDQRRLAHVERLVGADPATFRRQGAVVATYRQRGERTLGPYFSVRYRLAGRQRSFYLGRCDALAAAVRRVLAALQRRRRESLSFARIRAAVDAAVRHEKRRLGRLLHAVGLQLKGNEIRGWRTSLLGAKPRASINRRP